MELNQHLQADERAQRAEEERRPLLVRVVKAEEERQLMAKQLSKALENWAHTEEEMQMEQDCASELAKELSPLQGQ